MPLDAAHIWHWFTDLNGARSSGATSANPISFSEIDAYLRLQGIKPWAWEIVLLRQIDAIALSQTARKGTDGDKGQTRPEKPPATPAEVEEAKQRVRAAFPDRRVVKRQPKQPPQE